MDQLIKHREGLNQYLISPVLKTALASPKNFEKFKRAFLKKMARMKSASAHLYATEQSGALFRRHLNDHQYYLTELLQGLERQISPDMIMTFFVKEPEGLKLSLFRFMSALDSELMNMYQLYPRYFNLDGKLPLFSRLSRLNEFSEDMKEMKLALAKVDDEALVEVLEKFFYLFTAGKEYRGYTFGYGYQYYLTMEHVRRELRHGEGSELPERIRTCLWENGFNYPAFADYSITYLRKKYLDQVSDNDEKLRQLHSLHASVPVFTSCALQINSFPTLGDQFGKWLDLEVKNCMDWKHLKQKVEEEVKRRMDELKLKFNISVKELGMIMNAAIHAGVLGDAKQKISEAIPLMVKCLKTDNISSHSFLNAMNNRDSTKAAEAIADLQKMISWLREHTELREFYNETPFKHR